MLAGAPILLVHCQTQMPLIVQDQKYPSEFGTELELSARQSTSMGMKLSMELTAKVTLYRLSQKGRVLDGHNSILTWHYMTGHS